MCVELFLFPLLSFRWHAFISATSASAQMVWRMVNRMAQKVKWKSWRFLWSFCEGTDVISIVVLNRFGFLKFHRYRVFYFMSKIDANNKSSFSTQLKWSWLMYLITFVRHMPSHRSHSTLHFGGCRILNASILVSADLKILLWIDLDIMLVAGWHKQEEREKNNKAITNDLFPKAKHIIHTFFCVAIGIATNIFKISDKNDFLEFLGLSLESSIYRTVLLFTMHSLIW